MTIRKLFLFLLALSLGTVNAYAKKQSQYEQLRQLTPEQSALVDKAIAREKILIQNIQERAPLVETYIQDIRPDAKLGEVPVGDHYMLSRIDFGRAFFDNAYNPRSTGKTGKHGFFGGSISVLTKLTRDLGLDTNFTYNPLGFTEMMFFDPTGADRQHYAFNYVRREFLGSVRTWVFDVQPKVSGVGRFYGRIWIEDQEGNIVRLDGTFTQSRVEDASRHFFHFDSWRTNVQPGIWLPTAVYVEETHRDRDEKNSLGLKAQTHFWGYSLKLPTRESENVSVRIEDAEDKSDDSQDESPLEATRQWVTQAENNVIDRLVAAGLVAPLTPDGYEEKILDQIVTNLAVPNNLSFPAPVHCRVLLTTTLEATTVGNTILISKGLLDTLPNEESIASVVALELAHIVMGHHIDTRYAFNDRLMFPDEASFQRIAMYHTDHDNEDAAKQATKYLEVSMYKDKLASAGLFWAQLADREKVLKALSTPKLGDSLLRADGTPWMLDLAKSAPKINWDDLAQIPALPLGSWLRTNPWNDQVRMLNATRYAPMNAQEKMPFEVTPIYFRLQRMDASPTDQTAESIPHNAQAQPAASQPAATPEAPQE